MAERFRRQTPARSTPLRNWSGLYKPPNPASNTTDADRRASAQAELSSTTGQAVNAAYRVVEKHLLAGRRAAEHFAGLYKPERSRTSPDLSAIVERLIRQSMDLIPLWFEMLDALAQTELNNSATEPAAARNSEEAKQKNTSSRNGESVNAVKIESTSPVEIVLDLRQPVDGVPLRVLGLCTVEEGKPPITGVAFEAPMNGGRPTLSIRIPNGQPPGVYSGVVVDHTGHPAGTLSLRLSGTRDK